MEKRASAIYMHRLWFGLLRNARTVCRKIYKLDSTEAISSLLSFALSGTGPLCVLYGPLRTSMDSVLAWHGLSAGSRSRSVHMNMNHQRRSRFALLVRLRERELPETALWHFASIWSRYFFPLDTTRHSYGIQLINDGANLLIAQAQMKRSPSRTSVEPQKYHHSTFLYITIGSLAT